MHKQSRHGRSAERTRDTVRHELEKYAARVGIPGARRDLLRALKASAPTRKDYIGAAPGIGGMAIIGGLTAAGGLPVLPYVLAKTMGTRLAQGVALNTSAKYSRNRLGSYVRHHAPPPVGPESALRGTERAAAYRVRKDLLSQVMESAPMYGAHVRKSFGIDGKTHLAFNAARSAT